MKGVFENFKMKVGDKKEKGVATISAFEYKRENNLLDHFRNMRDGMGISDGKYVRLVVNGELMMSDTDMEKHSNSTFVNRAIGRVLVAGLGIGLVVGNLMDKLKKGEITELIIIEKYQDVIDLVSPQFKHKNIKIICADIFEWRPIKGEKFDVIYFDIWPTICVDNLSEIATLHRIFAKYLHKKNQYCWMNSWMRDHLRRLKRRGW